MRTGRAVSLSLTKRPVKGRGAPSAEIGRSRQIAGIRLGGMGEDRPTVIRWTFAAAGWSAIEK